MYSVWIIWTDREQGSLKAPATSKNHCLDFTDMPVSLLLLLLSLLLLLLLLLFN